MDLYSKYMLSTSIINNANKTSTASISGKHEHHSDVKIERRVLRENCKRKANDFIFNNCINTALCAIVQVFVFWLICRQTYTIALPQNG